jgi:hypothetical protein
VVSGSNLSVMPSRRYVFPQIGDDFAAIAARELVDVEDAEQQLLSWNLHLAARAGLGRVVGLLPSDIVFTEPPLRPFASGGVLAP